MTEGPPRPPTEWDFRAFIAVAEDGSYEEAARRMAILRGGYTRQAAQRAVAKIEKRVGKRLLQRKVDRRYVTTPAGTRVLQIAYQFVALHDRIAVAATQPTWTLACSPHHTTFVALAEDKLQRTEDRIRVDFLAQHDRAEHQFFGEPLDRLLSSEYQLIIGPPVSRTGLRSTPLYEARLEAMISRDEHPGDQLSLADLVGGCEAFLQPRDVRARRVLEDAIMLSKVADPGPAVRVAAETYETATSVVRLRSERRRRGDRRRVLVVPSDIALPFKEGMVFGGRDADRFKWVPIYNGDATLRLETCVTVRTEDAAALRPVIDALEAAVHELDRGPHRISGAPFT